MTELKLFLVVVSIDESKLQPAQVGIRATIQGVGLTLKTVEMTAQVITP